MATNNNKPISLGGLETFKDCIEEEILEQAQTLATESREIENKADIALSAALAAGGKSAKFTLSSANWKRLETVYHGEYTYGADIEIADITNTANADVIFDMDSIDICALATVAATCAITSGKVTVYARNEPDQNVDGVVVYANNSNGTGIGRTNCVTNLKKYVPNFGGWYNTELEDDFGHKSSMVRIPKFTWKDLGIGDSDELFPAFIVNGKEVNSLYIGKYMADENGCSVKGAAPKTTITYDQSQKLCKDMGDGWHMTTRLTWMAVALWSAKHGCQPEVTTDSDATGNMDVTHSHNRLESGIWDLAGLKYEWNSGMRTVLGELQVISADGVTFDNSAIVIDSSADSPNWYCINGLTGALMKPNGSGTTANSIKINGKQWGTTKGTTNGTGTIDEFTVATNICEKAKNMLIALGCILPDGVSTDGDYGYFYYNGAEYLPYVGGVSGGGARAGVFYVYCNYDRSGADANVGLRAAFCDL